MDELKRQAAARALEHVQDGMKLGLGTGSTARHFVDLLGEKVRAGLKVVGVPTSEATRALALRHGIPLTTLDDQPELDLAIDGGELSGLPSTVVDIATIDDGGGWEILRQGAISEGDLASALAKVGLD